MSTCVFDFETCSCSIGKEISFKAIKSYYLCKMKSSSSSGSGASKNKSNDSNSHPCELEYPKI